MSNKKRRSCLAALVSFLLAIILTAALIAAIPITFLNLFLTDHNIDVLVDHTISSIELDKIEFSTEEGDKTVADVILDITDEVEGLNYITEEQINDVLLNDFVKGFVSDTLKQYGMSINSHGWTPERIYGFIEGNQETIEQLAREAGYEGELPVIEEKKEMIIQVLIILQKWKPFTLGSVTLIILITMASELVLHLVRLILLLLIHTVKKLD